MWIEKLAHEWRQLVQKSCKILQTKVSKVQSFLFTSGFKLCMLYILTSVWMLRTPKAGQNSHFQR